MDFSGRFLVRFSSGNVSGRAGVPWRTQFSEILPRRFRSLQGCDIGGSLRPIIRRLLDVIVYFAILIDWSPEAEINLLDLPREG